MGPPSYFRRFCGSEVQHKLALASTYEGMLASMGPRTRRSLAGKRQQLEKNANVKFIAALEPEQALEVMLALKDKSKPQRTRNSFVPGIVCCARTRNSSAWASSYRMGDG